MYKYNFLTPQQRQRVQELENMSAQEWENLCKHCGVCCLAKVDTEMSTTLFMDYCCEHLDCATKKCKIYKDRINKQKGFCKKVTIDVILDNQLLPTSCGYVEYVFGPAKYPAKVDFTKVTPMSDSVFVRKTIGDILRHIIKDSINWHCR